jgi:hypothetical protein
MQQRNDGSQLSQPQLRRQLRVSRLPAEIERARKQRLLCRLIDGSSIKLDTQRFKQLGTNELQVRSRASNLYRCREPLDYIVRTLRQLRCCGRHSSCLSWPTLLIDSQGVE